jgi:hypothetical protein
VLVLPISGRTRMPGQVSHHAGPDPGTLTLGYAPEVIGDPDGHNGPSQPRARSGYAGDNDYDVDHAVVASLPSNSRLTLHPRRSHRPEQMMITAMTRIVMSIGQLVLTAGPSL